MHTKPTYEELEKRISLLEKKAEANHAVFETFADQSPNMVFINAKGRIMYVNSLCEKIVGYKKDDFYAADFNFRSLIAPEHLDQAESNFQKHMQGNNIEPHEYSIKTKDGQILHVILSTKLMDYKGEKSILGIMTDITERKQAEDALRESQIRYESFVKHFHGIAFRGNMDFTPVFFHGATEAITGYTEKDFVAGKPRWDQIIYPEDLVKISASLEKIRSVPNYSTQRGYRIIHKDGRIRWVREYIQNICGDSGKPAFVQGAMYDITEHKQAEKELREAHDKLESKVQLRTAELKKANTQLLTRQRKLRSLASQLSLAEEKERRRIATEVHDYIGQNLAFAKIKLGELRKSLSSPSPHTLEEVVQLVDKTIDDTRHLVSKLGSPVLYELGLVPALESLAQQFREKFFNVTFEDDKKPKPISDDVKIFVFRAIRELLANAVKHAKAANCTVSLKAEGAKLRLDVVDDGVGFDVEKAESVGAEERSFGLFSIRARLEPLGGSLEINSNPDEGTRITLFAPLIK